MVDVGLAYEAMNYKTPDSDCKAKQYGIALAVPVGQGAIRASYSKAKDIEGSYTGAVANTTTGSTGGCGAVTTAVNHSDDNGAKQYNIGYDHRLSKRTTLGVGYAAIKNDAGTGTFVWSGMSSSQNGAQLAPANGTDLSVFFVNMIHRF